MDTQAAVPQQLTEQESIRREKLRKLRQAGQDPYAITRYDRTHESTDILNGFDELEGKEVSVAGRMISKRVMGKASFAHILDAQGDLQVYMRRDDLGEEAYAAFKDMDIGDVIGAIETVMGRGSYFSPQLLASLTGRMRTREDAADEQLSSREREILVAVCRGLSNQEIADELFISKRTVDKHRANILEKTGCKNTASLVVYAIRNGIVDI